jgi:hypothetical protein
MNGISPFSARFGYTPVKRRNDTEAPDVLPKPDAPVKPDVAPDVEKPQAPNWQIPEWDPGSPDRAKPTPRFDEDLPTCFR